MTCSLTGLGPVLGWLRRCLGCVAMLALLAPMAAGSAVLAEPDARAVRKVVEAQLAAFAADDAKKAFSYASASIRAQFGDASRFMSMVRIGYPMVVRPATVSFFQAQADDTIEGATMLVRQAVHLRDPEGRLWKAIYLLERQADGGWRINGCVVTADTVKSLT